MALPIFWPEPVISAVRPANGLALASDIVVLLWDRCGISASPACS